MILNTHIFNVSLGLQFDSFAHLVNVHFLFSPPSLFESAKQGTQWSSLRKYPKKIEEDAVFLSLLLVKQLALATYHFDWKPLITFNLKEKILYNLVLLSKLLSTSIFFTVRHFSLSFYKDLRKSKTNKQKNSKGFLTCHLIFWSYLKVTCSYWFYSETPNFLSFRKDWTHCADWSLNSWNRREGCETTSDSCRYTWIWGCYQLQRLVCT